VRLFKTLLLLAATLFVFNMGAGSASAETMDKERVREIIKEYLFEEPQIIMEAVDKYRQDQQREQMENSALKLKEHLGFLTSAELPSVGSDNPDLTIIEFLDYNCGYCKRAFPDIQKLIEQDNKVRVVFIDMPVLGPTSKTASLWALAAYQQGKFFEYHKELMSFKGSKTEDKLAELAENVGLDVEQMRKDVKSEKVNEMLEKGVEIGQDIGVNGTPAFIVGDQLYPGYLGEEGLMRAVSEARK